jgi:outer membrane biosynthesis protein TonB
MRKRALVSFLVPLALVPYATPRNVASFQQPVISTSQSPKWTVDDERDLLTKAQAGDDSAQMWLGAAYEQGWFGNTNLPEALKWFRKSAEQGNPDAQNALGQMYEDGRGVIQDYSLAAEWYRKAAEHEPDLGGAGQGRNNLGMLYLDGLGVPQDYVQAYMWFTLSDFSGNPNLDTAKAHMTDGQILEAERLAREWKVQHTLPNVSQCPGSRGKGKVTLSVTVDAYGNVSQARALSGPEGLVPAALACAKSWKYQPPASPPQTKTVSISYGSRDCPRVTSERGEMEWRWVLTDKSGKVAAIIDGQEPPALPYPVDERKNGAPGKMVLSVRLNGDGSVKEAHAVQSLSPGIDEDVIDRLRPLKFKTPNVNSQLPSEDLYFDVLYRATCSF